MNFLLRKKGYLGILLMACLSSDVAFAHQEHMDYLGGFEHGVVHPIFGIDHLLAMVAVGLVAARFQRWLRWLIPGAFIGSMIIGGGVGMAGYELPGLELMIATSVVILGIAIALRKQYPIIVPMILALGFGFIHGQAHGAELPGGSAASTHALGFVLSTRVLYVCGIFAGIVIESFSSRESLKQIAGTAIALSSLLFFLS